MDLDAIIDSYTDQKTNETATVRPSIEGNLALDMSDDSFSFEESVAAETSTSVPEEVNLGLEFDSLPDAEVVPHEPQVDFDLSVGTASFEADNTLPEILPQEDEELRRGLSAIPDKLAFKIGEVADIVDVKQYVLRYWESEFEALRPKKSKQNQRMYTRKDIENVLLIKKLLYRDKFSIEGARKALRSLKGQVRQTKQWDQVADRYDSAIQHLHSLHEDIKTLRQLFL